MRWVYHKEDYLLLIRELAILLIIVSFLLLVPLIFAFIYGESATYRPFLISSAVSAVAGTILRFVPTEAHFERKHAIGLVVTSWPVVSLPSALPFYLSGTAPTYLDAFFEAISGWTTTGLTTIGGNADLFYHSINFWRNFMQYAGGLGIIIMGIIVLVPLRDWETTSELAVAAGRKYRIVPSLRNTIKIIALMYLGLLGISTVLFYLAGMGPFDAVNHAMAGLSTGGFSTRGGSLGAYGSNLITVVSLPVMILGNTNFVLIYFLLTKRWKKYLDDVETKVFWITFIVLNAILIFWFASRGVGYSNSLDVIFMITSALTTTGWSTVPAAAVFLQWAPLALMFIIIAMLFGANSSSTGGGIKAFRVGLMAKSIIWRIEKVVLPDSVVLKRRYTHLKNKMINDDEINHLYTFITIYFIVLISSFFIFIIFGHPILTSFYEVTSAIGTVGLSSGLTNTALNPVLKIILCINMWLGRIEVLPLLYFIGYVKGRS
ncbi:MAG: TrkH family potassium uptake protein [Thermoplasmata archaeon]